MSWWAASSPFFPLGPPCLRVNLLSALAGAWACALLFGLLRNRFNLGLSFSLPFAFLWMAGATAYPAALSAKNGIYQWTAVFLLAILGALFRGRIPPGLFSFRLVLGGHWMSMAAAGGGFAFLIWTQLRERNGAAKQLLRESGLPDPRLVPLSLPALEVFPGTPGQLGPSRGSREFHPPCQPLLL